MDRASSGLDHFYIFGDVYETLDTCDQLQSMLGRLNRQGLLDDEDLRMTKQCLSVIKDRVESHVQASNLVPKGPRLS